METKKKETRAHPPDACFKDKFSHTQIDRVILRRKEKKREAVYDIGKHTSIRIYMCTKSLFYDKWTSPVMMLTQNQKDTAELQRNRLPSAVDVPSVFNDTSLEPWVAARVKYPNNGSSNSKPITPPVTALFKDNEVGVVDTVDLSVEKDKIADLKFCPDLDSFIRDYSVQLATDDPVDASYFNGGVSSNSKSEMLTNSLSDNIFIFNLAPLTVMSTSAAAAAAASRSTSLDKLTLLLSSSDDSYNFREITDAGNPSRRLYFLRLKLSPACIRKPERCTIEDLLETSIVNSEVSVGNIVQAIKNSKHLVVFDRFSTLRTCSRDTYIFLKRLHQSLSTEKDTEGRDIVLLTVSGPQLSISTSGPVSRGLPVVPNRPNVRTRNSGFNKGGTVNKRRFNLKISIPKEPDSTDTMFLRSLKKDSITYSPSSLKKYFNFKIPDGIELNDKILPVWLREYTDRDKTDEVLVRLMHKFELLESLEMRRLSHCITKFVSGDQYDNNVSLTGPANGALTNSKLSTTTDTAVNREAIDLNPSIHQSIYSLPRLQRSYRKNKKKKKEREKIAMERIAETHLSSIPPTPLSSISSISPTSSPSLSPSPLPSSHGQEDAVGIDLHSGTEGSCGSNDNSLITPFDKYELSQGIRSFDKNRYSNILPYEHSRVKLRYSPVNLAPRVKNGSSTSIGDVVQKHSPLNPFGESQYHSNSPFRFADSSLMKSVEGGVHSVPPEATRKVRNLNRRPTPSNATPESASSELPERVLSSKPTTSTNASSKSSIGHIPINNAVHAMPVATTPIAMPVPVPMSLSFLNSSTALNSLNSADTKEDDLESTSGTPYGAAVSSSSTTMTTTTGDAVCSTYPNDPLQFSDYFNANYLSIPDINPDYTYIATQAPLPSTIDDFWRVVISNNIKVIVSLNSDDELRLRKWNIYWTNTPDNGRKSAYRINLIDTIEDIDNLSGCTLRIFQVLKNGSNETISVSSPREAAFSLVYQLQYSRWSDSMPTNMRDLLHLFQIKDQLVKAPVAYLSGLVNNPPSAVSLLKISKLQSCCRNFNKVVTPDSPNSRDIPSLVHCSAGCGRTGVFITLDFLINLLTNENTKEDNMIDVWNMKQDLIFIIVNEFRKQRLSMVQNLSQFISCYESMLQFFEIMKE